MGMYCGEAANARVMTTDAWLMVSFDRGATLNRSQGSLSTRNEADVGDEISPEVADVLEADVLEVDVLDADVLGPEDDAGVEDGNGASATRGGR